MSALYICYQSLLDPLTQTQVVAYLEGLASNVTPIVLLTFEPSKLTTAEVRTWEERLSQKGIVWRRLPYHKRPTLPATLWDVMTGTVPDTASFVSLMSSWSTHGVMCPP
ncbi:MAG: hypothetical protein R3B91_20085 [Planctomycetaceae bacterium]